MLINIASAKCVGIEALPVTVEVSISSGIGVHLVGLADVAVKESLLRTVTALQTLGFRIPGKKIVINLAPADIHKRGGGYDLPIALGIIAASEQLAMPDLDKYIILGELGLDGTVRPVSGALPIAEMAQKEGLRGCILPEESALETLELKQVEVYGVRTLADALEVVCGKEGKRGLLIDETRKETASRASAFDGGVMDFSEIMGQEAAKRGLEIAAAGGHNVIMVGAPGSGKSSLAKAMCRILPPMTTTEAVQTSKIYSVAGKGRGAGGLIRQRPFRAPHNSASVPALIGGGSDDIYPGEISLAHNGVLFLDEFCEIPKRTIESLRAPIEDGYVVVSRLRTKITYPASFTLVAATNPCPCGYYGEGDKCTCTAGQRQAYLAKLSGPLMDRIDIQVWMHPVPAASLVRKKAQESSDEVAKRVCAAREIQKERFKDEGICCNSQMNSRQIDKYCPLTPECRTFLEQIMEKSGFSARACSRIIKLSRTIADLEGKADIEIPHLAEAVSYRFLDKVDR